MPLISFKLTITRKFSRDSNLSCINEKFCSTARLTWPSMIRTALISYLDLVVTLSWSQWPLLQATVLCVDTQKECGCRGCRSAEEEETVIQFLCQCPYLARCRYRLFSSPTLISLTELSSIDIKDIALFIMVLQRGVANFFLLDLEELGQCRGCVFLWRHKGQLCALKWAFGIKLLH